MSDTTQRYEGTCAVCGEPKIYEHDYSRGVIDIDIGEDGRAYTWVRHYATAPPGANPDCARYSSKLAEVPWPREGQNQERSRERPDALAPGDLGEPGATGFPPPQHGRDRRGAIMTVLHAPNTDELRRARVEMVLAIIRRWYTMKS